GGTIDFVGSVGAAAGSATVAAVFVHASDIDVASGQVTRDLHVADEGAIGNLSLVGPGVAVISGVADEDIRAATEIVPGNIHPPVKVRQWPHVGPTRFAVVLTGVNAVMGPALRVRRSGGLVPAQPAAAAVEPDGVPSGGWAVIQNYGASGVREGALTVGEGEARER